MRDCLSHKLGTHRLSHCSLEVDTAGDAGELEDLAAVLTVLVLSSLDLHILLFINETLQ